MLQFVTSFLPQFFENCKDGNDIRTPGGRYELGNSVFSRHRHCTPFLWG